MTRRAGKAAFAKWSIAPVTELYVLPDSRGRGVGRALIEALEEHFTILSCEGVHIDVFAPNVGARDLYRTLGYEPRHISQFKCLRPHEPGS